MPCVPVTKDVLRNPRMLYAEAAQHDFQKALALARKEAERPGRDPMLLAWFDRAANRWSPPVE
jgi:hypothetical protein